MICYNLCHSRPFSSVWPVVNKKQVTFDSPNTCHCQATFCELTLWFYESQFFQFITEKKSTQTFFTRTATYLDVEKILCSLILWCFILSAGNVMERHRARKSALRKERTYG
jgi:hypothetical protein